MKILKSLLAALCAALLIALVLAGGALKRYDRWSQDTLFQRPGVPSERILLIGIDEETLRELGPYGPSYRQAMALALEKLGEDPEKRPAVTAVDILYDGESNSAADSRLAEAAGRLGNVVTASMAEFGSRIVWENGRARSLDAAAILGYVQPYEALRAVTVQGHINAMNDTDGVLRHALLYVEPEGERVWSMAAAAAGLYAQSRGEALKLPPVNAAGHFYLPYTGRPGSYSDGVSLYSLLSGQLPAELWAGKIVLIGPYAPSLQDAYFTSIDRGLQMYGVEYQANIIQCLLEQNFKRELSDGPQLAVLVLLGTLAALLFLRLKAGTGALACLGLMLLGPLGSLLLYRLGYVSHVLWLPFALPVLYLLAAAIHYLQAVRERQALALVKERYETELALATRIQTSALPKEDPAFPERKEFEIYASMSTAREVGGDLYDYFLLDEDHLCMVIGDVSGKGVPAALFMMLSGTLIRHIAGTERDPAAILTEVNREICRRNPEEMFVTVWLGVLEISTGLLRCANAGHEYPAVKEPGTDFSLLKDRHGLVVGGMEGLHYREYSLQLKRGSLIFVYTDGVTEANRGDGQLFGPQRLLQALNGPGEDSPRSVAARVKQAAEAFTGDGPRYDDMTMLCLRWLGPQTDE